LILAQPIMQRIRSLEGAEKAGDIVGEQIVEPSKGERKDSVGMIECLADVASQRRCNAASPLQFGVDEPGDIKGCEYRKAPAKCAAEELISCRLNNR
jgi:hypothetical protein